MPWLTNGSIMYRFLVCLVAASTVGGAVTPATRSSSRRSSFAERASPKAPVCSSAKTSNGVVLLAKKSALSRAIFKEDKFAEIGYNNKELQQLTGQLSELTKAPRLQSQASPSVSWLAKTIAHSHGSHGFIMIALLVCCIAAIAVCFKFRQTKQHEIYDLDANVGEKEHDWKHETWIRGHRPQHDLEDSPRPSNILPRQGGFPQPARSQRQPGSAQSLKSSMASSSGTPAPGARAADGSDFLGRSLDQKLDRAGERIADTFAPATYVVNAAGERVTGKALDTFKTGQETFKTGRDKGELVAGKLRSGLVGGLDTTLHHTDKALGGTFKKLDSKLQKAGSKLQNRLDEARAGNL